MRTYRTKQVADMFGIHKHTLLSWVRRGYITPLKTPTGEYRWTQRHIQELQKLLGKQPVFPSDEIIKQPLRINVIYCRTSSQKEKHFIYNQVQACKDFCLRQGWTAHEIITDIASSFNFKRKGLRKLLDLVLQGNVERVIVYDRDRLTRFAFDFFVDLFRRYETEIVVVDETISEHTVDEITKELISFIHYITSKLYGSRKYTKHMRQQMCEALKCNQ